MSGQLDTSDYEFIAEFNQGPLLNKALQIEPNSLLIFVFREESIEIIVDKFNNEINSRKYIKFDFDTCNIIDYVFNRTSPLFFTLDFSNASNHFKTTKADSHIILKKEFKSKSINVSIKGQSESCLDFYIDILDNDPSFKRKIDYQTNQDIITVVDQLKPNFNLMLNDFSTIFANALKNKIKVILEVCKHGIRIRPSRPSKFGATCLRRFRGENNDLPVDYVINNDYEAVYDEYTDKYNIIHNDDCLYSITLGEDIIKNLSKLNSLDSKSGIVQVFIFNSDYIRFDLAIGSSGILSVIAGNNPDVESEAVSSKSSKKSSKSSKA